MELTQESVDAILTPTERAIYELLPLGLPDKSIANVVGRKYQTVKNHLYDMQRKKNARNRSHLAAMAAFDQIERDRHEPMVTEGI